MLLGCPVESLPDQHELVERVEFVRALRTHLKANYGSTYQEVGPEKFAEVAARNDHHLIIGETVRTTADHDVWHAVVGKGGEVVWDVHPSRVGLTKVVRFGVIEPLATEVL
jgi:hypothetical protein